MFKASHYGYYDDDEEEELDIDLNNQMQVDTLNNPVQPQQPTLAYPPPPQIPQQHQPPKESKGFFSNIFDSSPFSGKPQPPPPQYQQYQPPQQPYQQQPQQPYQQQPQQPYSNKPSVFSKTKVKKANTNVLVTDLGTIAQESAIATGDPIFCKKCKSVFSNINKFEEIKLKDGQTVKNVPTAGGLEGEVWKCEFCLTDNEVHLVEQEIPKSNIIDYILEHAPVGGNTSVNNNNNNNANTPVKPETDETLVLFCIDTSGSMECTHQVPSTFQKRPQQKSKPDDNLGIFGAQQKPHAKTNYITRLECVQIGIESQLDDMEKNHPSRKVGIVTFAENVHLLGKDTLVIKGDELNNIPVLLEKGSGFEIQDPLVKSKKDLVETVYKMRGTGSTALGPAIASCIGIASKTPGAKIICCTDGHANKGVGNIDLPKEAEEFYNQMGAIAQRNGTTISVLTIKGTDCRMEYLGKLAEATGGDVNIVDPIKMDDDFKDLLALPVVATNVTIKLVLHHGLYVTDNGQISDSSMIEKTIGSTNAETSYSFEYGVKRGNKLDKSLKSLPFQLQIYYTTLTGMKCVRIITNTQEVTSNKDLAEENADVGLLGQNLVQASSNIAATGDYLQTRAKTASHSKAIEQIVQKQQSKPQPAHLQQQQQQQLNSAKVWMSQAQRLEETISNEVQTEFMSTGGYNSKNTHSRKSDRSDETANVIYNMKKMNNTTAKKFSK